MKNAKDIIATLRGGLERIEALWVDYQSEEQDDFEEGYESGLAECKEIARDTINAACEKILTEGANT